MTPEEAKAHGALAAVIPILEKLGLQWVITGGFACYVYGVKRPLTDIDIDVDCSKDDAVFQKLLDELAPHISQPLEHLLDQNYDNYNFEVSFDGQVVDICPMREMNVIVKGTERYENFYKDGFPRIEIKDFFGLPLPLLAKDLIIKNKEMLVWLRDSDRNDIAGLKAMLA